MHCYATGTKGLSLRASQDDFGQRAIDMVFSDKGVITLTLHLQADFFLTTVCAQRELAEQGPTVVLPG